MGLLKGKEYREAVKDRWANLGDFSNEGVVLEHDLSVALPEDTLVRSIGDGELYVSIDSTVPSFAKLTGPTSTPDGAIIVAKVGGDHTTIAAGLAAASSGDIVVVYPGTYAESVTIPAGVRLVGFQAGQSVIISGADATSTRVTLSSGSTLREITVVNPSTGPNPGVDASGLTAGQLAVVNGVVFQGGGGGGPLLDGPGAGLMVVKGCRHNGGAVNGSAFKFNGGGQVYIQELLLGVGSSTIAVEFADVIATVQELTFTPGIYTTTDGICISHASARLQASSIMFPDFGTLSVTNALRISADGCKISLTSSHLHGATLGLLVDGGLVGTGTEFSLIGELRLEEISAPSGWMGSAEVMGLIVDDGVSNDPGIRALEFSVGIVDRPSELAVGTGDSITPLSVWTYDSSLTSWTDVTTAAQSRSGSTFTMPSDVGDKLYVGFDRPFVNIRTDQTQLAIYGSGNIREMIWTGAGYEEIRAMTSDANYPHLQYGNSVFDATLEEQVRLDIDGDADPTSGTWQEPYINWTAEDPMSAGTAYYYLVFEVTTANLTQAPIFERIKVGFDRMEINSTGFPEQFGIGQGEPKQIPVRERRTFTGGGSPGSATFNLSANVTVTVEKSVFTGNAKEGFVVEHIIPRGVDTSRMYEFDIDWVTDGTATGDVELEIIVLDIQEGNNINAGTLAEIADAKVITITGANNNGVLIRTRYYFALPKSNAGDTLAVAVFRDATAGNLDDTLTDGIQIWDTNLKAIRWTAN